MQGWFTLFVLLYVSHLSQHHPVWVCPLVLVLLHLLQGLSGGAAVELAPLSTSGRARVRRVLHKKQGHKVRQQQLISQEDIAGPTCTAASPEVPLPKHCWCWYSRLSMDRSSCVSQPTHSH